MRDPQAVYDYLMQDPERTFNTNNGYMCPLGSYDADELGVDTRVSTSFTTMPDGTRASHADWELLFIRRVDEHLSAITAEDAVQILISVAKPLRLARKSEKR